MHRQRVSRAARRASGRIREIDITNTGLSENVREQLIQASPEGIRFIYDNAPTAFADNLSLSDALNHWGIDQSQPIATQTNQLVPENQMSNHQSQNLSCKASKHRGCAQQQYTTATATTHQHADSGDCG